MNEPIIPPIGTAPPLPPPPPVPPLHPSREERLWAMIAHLSALTGLFTGGIGNIVGPLIIWQIKKETMPFAAAEAREALNFNISWLIWGILLTAITFILMFIAVGVLLIPVLAILGIAWAVLSVIAGLKANDGIAYRYPLTLRLVS